MTAALQATALGKRYGHTWALRDCTLTLPDGRVAALVGPNGAGKTTLLQLAVRLTAPTCGHITIFGLAPHAHPKEVLPRIGFVVQWPRSSRSTGASPSPRCSRWGAN